MADSGRSMAGLGLSMPGLGLCMPGSGQMTLKWTKNGEKMTSCTYYVIFSDTFSMILCDIVVETTNFDRKLAQQWHKNDAKKRKLEKIEFFKECYVL